MPLAEALAIPAYDHYLEEALEPGIGLRVHVSYRRATSEVERIAEAVDEPYHGTSPASGVGRRHDPFESMKDKDFRFLVVDGTKVHLQGAAGKDLGKWRCVGRWRRREDLPL